jgi:hypothetical protein
MTMKAFDEIVNELASHYHVDMRNIGAEFRRQLPNYARESSIRLHHLHLPGLPEALESLLNREHPLHQRIEDETQFGWTDEDDDWLTFSELITLIIAELRRLSSGDKTPEPS